MATAFSTPFWIAVTGVVAVAACVAHLARPEPGARLGSSARALEAIDRSTRALADVAVADDMPQPPAAGPALAPVNPFTVDGLGRLVVTAQTLAVLDSWLASLGRGQPLTALEPRLRAELPPLAAERAWPLLNRYAEYKKAEHEMLNMPASRATAATPRELLDARMALRRRHFDSVTVQELFGVQEARAVYASEVQRIFADASLNPAQQAQRLLALRMALPPEVAAAEFGGSEFSFALERQVAEMRAKGESDAEVLYLRRQFADAEGAVSIVEQERVQHDMRRQAWELRHAAFVRQRDQLFAADMDVAEKQRQLEDLLREHLGPRAKSQEWTEARRYAGI